MRIQLSLYFALSVVMASPFQVNELQPVVARSSLEIQSVDSNKCIGPSLGSVADGAPITHYVCTGDSSQAWQFHEINGRHKSLVNLKSGLCLSISGGSLEVKAGAIQSKCLNATNQLVIPSALESSGAIWKISFLHSGLSLELPSQNAADGTHLEQNKYRADTNQQWQFVPLPRKSDLFQSSYKKGDMYYSKMCVGPLSEATVRGSNLKIQKCVGNSAYNWRFVSQNFGTYNLLNLGTGLCLDVGSDSAVSSNKCGPSRSQQFSVSMNLGIHNVISMNSNLSFNVTLHETEDIPPAPSFPHGVSHLQRRFDVGAPLPAPDAAVSITNLGNSKCLGPQDGAATEDAFITIQPCCKEPSQAWRLVPVSLRSGQNIVVNAQSGLCMEVFEGSATTRATIILRRCTNSTDQLFSESMAAGGWVISAAKSGLALDVSAAVPAIELVPMVQDASGRLNQLWRFIDWPPPPQILQTPMYLKCAASSKCIAPQSAMMYDGAGVTLQTCSGDASQAWSFVSVGCNRYRIVNMKSAMCLDVSAGPRADGAGAIQSFCDGAALSQQWIATAIESYINLAAGSSGLFLDVEAQKRTDGAHIVQSSYTGSSTQQWLYVPWVPPPPLPVGYVGIRERSSGRCVSPRSGMTADQTPVVLAACRTSDWAQMWQFRVVDDGRYILVNQKTGSCLAVLGGTSARGAAVVISDCQKPSGPTEQWVPTLLGSGAWAIAPVLPGIRLNALGAPPFAGARKVQARSMDQSLRRWSLTPAPIPAGPLSQWAGPFPMPIVAIAAVIMADGRVTFWSSSQIDTYFTGEPQTYSSTYDPATGVVSESLITSIKADLFCPGTALLSNGVLMVAGGVSSGATNFFDGAVWSNGPPLKIPRGYNSATLTADGSVFTLGGSWSGSLGGKFGELWTERAGWRVLSGVPADRFLTADGGGIFRQDNQMWLVAAEAGWVFHAGPSRAMHWISLVGEGAVVPAGLRGDDGDAMNGNAVLYDANRIVTFGGAPDYENGAATAAVFVIDISAGPGRAVRVRRASSMRLPRAMQNSVVLPTGQVIIIGGQGGRTKIFSDQYAQLSPELWDPATQTSTLLHPMSKPRMYHSIALLLLDGRVLASGGGACGSGCVANHFDFEILTPPYLLNPDGSPAARPVIVSAPATAAVNSTLAVSAVDAASFSLVRMSSVTHTINTDQRRIPLPATLLNGMYKLQIPGANIALPGNYMLFALSSRGTPSVARVVRLN